jgi:drug/metabolite transporter (DMT)-like permease
VVALFAAVAVLWGIPFALIKIALEHGAEPLLIAWTRVVIGAVILAGRRRRPRAAERRGRRSSRSGCCPRARPALPTTR